MKLCDKEENIFLENRIVHIMTLPCVLLIDSFKWIVFQQTKYSPEDPLKNNAKLAWC